MFYDKIQGYVESGMITLHLALSRSRTRKKYVQDKLMEMGEEACKLLLNPKLHYYGT
jgi:sulfite reductase alpha subunit-like flavoprotein